MSDLNIQLSERAMLATLNITTWTATKHDRKASLEVAQNHQASARAGRYNKILVSKDALAKIKQLESQMRDYHYKHTMPWDDNGQRVLPATMYFDYTTETNRLIQEFCEAADDFCDNQYRGVVAKAQQDLGSLFDIGDYPTPAKVRSKFSAKVKVMNMPDADDFRVQLGQGEVARIKAQIKQDELVNLASAMQEPWQRMYEAVAHMVERLRVYDNRKPDDKGAGSFRDTLVTNIEELVDILPKLNLIGDVALDSMAKEIKDSLVVAPQTLRDSANIRKNTMADAEAILSKMSGYMGSVAA